MSGLLVDRRNFLTGALLVSVSLSESFAAGFLIGENKQVLRSTQCVNITPEAEATQNANILKLTDYQQGSLFDILLHGRSTTNEVKSGRSDKESLYIVKSLETNNSNVSTTGVFFIDESQTENGGNYLVESHTMMGDLPFAIKLTTSVPVSEWGLIFRYSIGGVEVVARQFFGESNVTQTIRDAYDTTKFQNPDLLRGFDVEAVLQKAQLLLPTNSPKQVMLNPNNFSISFVPLDEWKKGTSFEGN